MFDCDGTLIDSQETILHGLGVGFAAVGLPAPERAVALSIVGLSLEVAFAQLTAPEHRHMVPAMADAYREAKVARRLAGLDHDPLYPGALAALDALSARPDVLLGVATGKAMRGVRHMQEAHGLEGRFVTIQTADKAPSKPHPGMILQAMEETGAEAARTVMIGDTGFDMEMARAAGVAGIGVTWGYHPRERLAQAEPARIIDGFDMLLPALGETLGWQDVVAGREAV
ncbi:HAD-IA family hydrolase [Stappia sp.]|uniref:HAD-IA family hydrolase n=1 Tax=Stappia sp. TaxID=1870903 RepID=UPI003A993EC0